MAQRYEMREEVDDLWSIIDLFTGRPAVFGDFLMVGLKLKEANHMVSMLKNKNLSHTKARIT